MNIFGVRIFMVSSRTINTFTWVFRPIVCYLLIYTKFWTFYLNRSFFRFIITTPIYTFYSPLISCRNETTDLFQKVVEVGYPVLDWCFCLLDWCFCLFVCVFVCFFSLCSFVSLVETTISRELTDIGSLGNHQNPLIGRKHRPNLCRSFKCTNPRIHTNFRRDI